MIPLIFIWKLIRVWIIWVQICRAVLRKSSQSSRLKNVNPYCKLSIIIKSYGKLFVYSWKNCVKCNSTLPEYLIVRSQPQNKWWFKVSYLKYEKKKMKFCTIFDHESNCLLSVHKGWKKNSDQIHFTKKSSHHQRYLVHSFLIMSLGKSVILAWPGLVSVIN